MDDQAVAAVIGAIIVLAVLGIGIVYVNAYHVPRQGAALEVSAAENGEVSLVELAGELALGPRGPFAHDIPLRADRPTPPLMSGIVLTPARGEGHVALVGDGATIGVSVVVPAPATGVPAGDPSREAVGWSKMRVHLLGTATGGQPLGAIRVVTGGAHFDASETLLEGGAVLSDTKQGSAVVAPPAMSVDGDLVGWRLPLLAGSASELSGAAAAQVALSPGPEAQLGGGSKVEELRIRIATAHAAAWKAALEDVIGSRGVVTSTTSAPDEGTVEATLTNVELRLFVVRYQVSLAERAG